MLPPTVSHDEATADRDKASFQKVGNRFTGATGLCCRWGYDRLGFIDRKRVDEEDRSLYGEPGFCPTDIENNYAGLMPHSEDPAVDASDLMVVFCHVILLKCSSTAACRSE